MAIETGRQLRLDNGYTVRKVFTLRLKGKPFRFRMWPCDDGRYDLKVLARPYSQCATRSMNGLKTNLINDECILIARAHRPSDEASARALAQEWARGFLNYIEEGTPFRLPRDPDL